MTIGRLFLVAVLLPITLWGGSTNAEPIRLTREFDGTSAEVEVRGLPRQAALEAGRAALDAVWRVDVMLRGPGEGTLAELQEAVPGTRVVLHEELARELTRSLALCVWSGGAWGPLGAPLNTLWHDGGGELPQPGDLREAVGRTGCGRLDLRNTQPPTASLQPGTRVDLTGIARGWAADEATAVLVEHGVGNAMVVVGNVLRAMGPGPTGSGWPIRLPEAPGDDEPMDRFWLRDRAVAFHTLETMQDRPIIDHRTGVPARGTAAVAVVADGAADAQGLATTLFVLGNREGNYRLGGLRPRPFVLFVLGEGTGAGLVSSIGWYEGVPRMR